MNINNFSNNESNENSGESTFRYLTPLKLDTKTIKKTDFLKKYGIKYIDYKDPNFLLKFINSQGKILSRKITGLGIKNQDKISIAIKRARHIALLPFVSDELR
jgi:small subunit ribosomal protein S18